MPTIVGAVWAEREPVETHSPSLPLWSNAALYIQNTFNMGLG